MSVWTSIIGCLRLSGSFPDTDHTKKIQKILGPICQRPNWDRRNVKLPLGSEDSLKYQFIPNVDPSFDIGLIVFYGSLRDFDYVDYEKVVTWWYAMLTDLESSGYTPGHGTLSISFDNSTITLEN